MAALKVPEVPEVPETGVPAIPDLPVLPLGERENGKTGGGDEMSPKPPSGLHMVVMGRHRKHEPIGVHAAVGTGTVSARFAYIDELAPAGTLQ